MDEFEDTKDILFDEREEIMAEEGGEVDLPSLEKKKVIDNATNMTEVEMDFQIEDIELTLSQVIIFYP